ncbi:MAG: hemolysin III family protein [Treponema sp.]|nr:hemolysin III family protein [Treponema sp.]
MVKPQPAPEIFPFFSVKEDNVSAVLHGIGALGAAAGLILFVLNSCGYWDGLWKGGLILVSLIIFTATMITLFLSSTLYHAVKDLKKKFKLRDLDHMSIYIFIAGAYTPFCLIGLKGAWGWTLCAIEWVLALIGVILYTMDYKALKKHEVAVKLVMGWIVLAAWVPLRRSIPDISFILLIGGGIVYSLGTVVFHKKDILMNHAIWHIFVLGGALCHWLAVWYILASA